MFVYNKDIIEKMVPPDNIIDALNDQLLQATGEPQEKSDEPKRNSKDDIITKIIKCAEENNVTLDYSNTKLRRMTKTQLNKLLAGTIEKGMQQNMAEQVGVKRGASEKLIALGALRMIHNLCANATEQGLNSFLPSYGYEVRGFAKTLDDPPVREAVDACLEEIALESDVLGYIESPFARLGIAWGGAIMTCLRTKQNNRNSSKHASFVGSRQARPKNTFQPGPLRRPANGQEQRRIVSSEEDEV